MTRIVAVFVAGFAVACGLIYHGINRILEGGKW